MSQEARRRRAQDGEQQWDPSSATSDAQGHGTLAYDPCQAQGQRGEFSERGMDSDPHRHASARPEHVEDRLQKRTHEIEDGLSKLQIDFAYVGHWPDRKWKSVINHAQISRGFRGKREGPNVKKMSPEGVDLLEAYCDEESQLTKHVIQRGGRAVRFTKRDGDLSAPEGQEILWAWIHLLEPKNVWVAPECRHWGNFSRFNVGCSLEMYDQIQRGRASDKPNLVLCNQIYLHQVSHDRHFHLE